MHGKASLRMLGSDSAEINAKRRWHVFWGEISTTTKKHQNEHIKHTRHSRSREICQHKEGLFYGRSIACQSNWRRKEVQKKTQQWAALNLYVRVFFPPAVFSSFGKQTHHPVSGKLEEMDFPCPSHRKTYFLKSRIYRCPASSTPAARELPGALFWRQKC